MVLFRVALALVEIYDQVNEREGAGVTKNCERGNGSLLGPGTCMHMQLPSLWRLHHGCSHLEPHHLHTRFWPPPHVLQALMCTRESSDVYMLLQGCAQMTFDGSRLVDTACCGYAYLQPAGLAALRQRYLQEVAQIAQVGCGWLPCAA